MRSFIWRVIINALALFAMASIFPNIEINSAVSAIIAALLLGLLNAFIRPLILILSLPLTILTLGLFTLVVNGFMLWLVSRFVSGFNLAGFGTAIIAAIILSIISGVLSWLLGKPDKS